MRFPFVGCRLLVRPEQPLGSGYGRTERRIRVQAEAEATLVSSLVSGTDGDEDSNMHMPVLDIDFKAHLIPSATDDHSHLFLDKEITWAAYKKLLEALAEAGIIEKGYARASIARGASFARLPGVVKGKEDQIPPPDAAPAWRFENMTAGEENRLSWGFQPSREMQSTQSMLRNIRRRYGQTGTGPVNFCDFLGLPPDEPPPSPAGADRNEPRGENRR